MNAQDILTLLGNQGIKGIKGHHTYIFIILTLPQLSLRKESKNRYGVP
jgi:hypothetical protein